MAVVEINWHPTARQLRVFSALLIAFAAAVSAWLYYKTDYSHIAIYVLTIGASVGVVGFAWPPLARVVYVVWMVIVLPIGWVVSHVALAALFYLVFTPIAIIMKLCGYDSMQRKFDRQAATYWKRRPQNDDNSRYFKQF
ncbi:MAG: hypothetical protein H8E44_34585 [Planctomycetes bacterium]|nr:hypothetical protein [Planctomycetota bacterium]MBL7043437.1 hypothetical protein [Pirellulaceae bacterium]